jgi:hypothetical protein
MAWLIVVPPLCCDIGVISSVVLLVCEGHMSFKFLFPIHDSAVLYNLARRMFRYVAWSLLARSWSAYQVFIYTVTVQTSKSKKARMQNQKSLLARRDSAHQNQPKGLRIVQRRSTSLLSLSVRVVVSWSAEKMSSNHREHNPLLGWTKGWYYCNISLNN